MVSKQIRPGSCITGQTQSLGESNHRTQSLGLCFVISPRRSNCNSLPALFRNSVGQGVLKARPCMEYLRVCLVAHSTASACSNCPLNELRPNLREVNSERCLDFDQNSRCNLTVPSENMPGTLDC